MIVPLLCPVAWIQGEDLLVNETAGTVTLPFRRFAGDVVLRSRAFARTRDGPPGQAQGIAIQLVNITQLYNPWAHM